MTQSTASVVSESAATDRQEAPQAADIVGGRADESTPEFEPMDFHEDDIERLEIPDLNDLGDLEDL